MNFKSNARYMARNLDQQIYSRCVADIKKNGQFKRYKNLFFEAQAELIMNQTRSILSNVNGEGYERLAINGWAADESLTSSY